MPAVPDHYFDQYIAPSVTSQGFGMPRAAFASAAGRYALNIMHRMRLCLQKVQTHSLPPGSARDAAQETAASLEELAPLEQAFLAESRTKGLLDFSHAEQLFMASSPDNALYTASRELLQHTRQSICCILGDQCHRMLPVYFGSESDKCADFIEAIAEKQGMYGEGLALALRAYLSDKLRELFLMRRELAD